MNFDFNVREANKYNDDFESTLTTSVDIPQSEKKRKLYYDFFSSFNHEVNLSGNAGELCRSRFGVQSNITAKDLAKIFGRDDSVYAIQQSQKR